MNYFLGFFHFSQRSNVPYCENSSVFPPCFSILKGGKAAAFGLNIDQLPKYLWVMNKEDSGL